MMRLQSRQCQSRLAAAEGGPVVAGPLDAEVEATARHWVEGVGHRVASEGTARHEVLATLWCHAGLSRMARRSQAEK